VGLQDAVMRRDPIGQAEVIPLASGLSGQRPKDQGETHTYESLRGQRAVWPAAGERPGISNSIGPVRARGAGGGADGLASSLLWPSG